MISIESTKDFKVLAQLNAHVQTWHHQHYPTVFKEFNSTDVSDFFKEQLKNVSTYAFLAKYNGEVCGFMLCFERERLENPFQHSERILLVDQIGILPEFQRRGIARSLLEKAESLSKELNCQSMQLNHWMDNDGASEFFKGFGFVPFLVQMKKNLNS